MKKIPWRLVLLVLLGVLALAFAVGNSGKVPVWPFGYHPLTLIIGIAFGLGAGVGALGHSLYSMMRGRSSRVLEGVPHPTTAIQAGQRDHPGRP